MSCKKLKQLFLACDVTILYGHGDYSGALTETRKLVLLPSQIETHFLNLHFYCINKCFCENIVIMVSYKYSVNYKYNGDIKLNVMKTGNTKKV